MEQNSLLCQAGDLLLSAFEQVEQMDNAHKQIALLEEDADVVCVRITRALSQTFITPIDREDILRINQCQEEAIDALQSLSTRVHIYEFKRIRFPALQLVRTMQGMLELTRPMLRGLSKKQDCHKTRAFRNLRGECEMLLSVGIAELHDIKDPSQADVLDLIKWGQAYDRIELTVSKVVQLAEAIEEAVLKNA